MSAFVPVETFFSHVYLVDLSTSLCEVARQRFKRLGWNNVTVVCQDARSFRLPDPDQSLEYAEITTRNPCWLPDGRARIGGADLITMSYSLSMIPGLYYFDLQASLCVALAEFLE